MNTKEGWRKKMFNIQDGAEYGALVVDPPYELAGHFLCVEAHPKGTRPWESWPFTVLLPELQNHTEEFAYGGDAFHVEIKGDTAKVMLAIDFPFEECVLPTELLLEIVLAWQDYLKNNPQ